MTGNPGHFGLSLCVLTTLNKIGQGTGLTSGLCFDFYPANQEIQNKQKVGPSDDTPRRGPESLPVGHHDIITDIATFQTTQGFIVTASRDGIVKVWK